MYVYANVHAHTRTVIYSIYISVSRPKFREIL